MPLYVLAKIENFMLFMYFLFSSGAFKGNSNGFDFVLSGLSRTIADRPKTRLKMSLEKMLLF